MSMSFLNQQDKLSRLLGDSETDSESMWPLADRKFEINRGEVQFARDSKSLLGYATGTVASQTISVPSDWIETFILIVDDEQYTNDREIALADWERFQDSGDDYFYYWVDSSGNKKLNFINANQNGDTYKLYYFRKPTTDLSADGDESIHADEYREASVYYAAAELLDNIGKTQMADKYRMKYQFFVDKAKAEAEAHYLNKLYARPDIQDAYKVDKDKQGIGTIE